ncbi:MAG: type I restriction endonuclease [Gallionella sp.]|nr:type I restriction endonuclease [Gallionella sp.]
MERLSRALQEYQTTHHEAAGQLESIQEKLRQSKNEQAFWEQMAADAEQAKSALEKRLAEQQTVSTAQPKRTLVQFVSAANTAASAVQLDEADTRKLIDQQLRQAGWEADTQTIKYNKGARPERGRNLAIAEWPTESGPADYVLFVGLMPIAVAEAKRKNVDVSGALQQARRYSRTFTASAETVLSDVSVVGEASYRVPFAFSSNGRPYLRQLSTRSGIWFCDLRRAENLAHALDGWYTPEGLTALLKRDEVQAHEQLASDPFNYGFHCVTTSRMLFAPPNWLSRPGNGKCCWRWPLAPAKPRPALR